jgi:NAD(P)H-hydrate epimerase
MRDADRRTTEECGVPSLTLMENAGTRVVEEMERALGEDLRRSAVIVLCGKGNNGGDGLVVARLLKARGCHPAVWLFSAPADVRGDAAVNLKRWVEAGNPVRVVQAEEEWKASRGEVARANVVVDALFGTGLSGPAQGLLASVIEDVNRFCAAASVFAVDIPSGLPSDGGEVRGPFIRADCTVTFTAPKVAHVFPPACLHAGKWKVVDIGTPQPLLDDDSSLKLQWIEPGVFAGLPLRRKPEAHKGDFGHALIIAGSRGKTGAAVLAGAGAMRAGAGLVTVATPLPLQLAVAAGMPEIMTEGLLATDADSISLRNFDYNRFAGLTAGKSALAMGPGLSQHPETQQFVRRVLTQCPLPTILDADGLNAFAGSGAELRSRMAEHLAVTPHPGEMARLAGVSAAQVQHDRLGTALRAAADWNALVILKGYRTIVATPDGQAFVNTTGNPGMATGGTGDVLTGILAGLTAQFGTTDWARVLSLGVYLHGMAGDMAAEERGEASLVASDLLSRLPAAFLPLLKGVPNA